MVDGFRSKVDLQFLKIAAPTVGEALVRVPGTFKCPGYAANEMMEVPEDACTLCRGDGLWSKRFVELTEKFKVFLGLEWLAYGRGVNRRLPFNGRSAPSA